ncbi:AfsR/SARP family transcriptional regulator [Streptomyces sp. H27-S2]|uniref:AfsR/SARP family transcriptional regulator n=1 Tax=Streptomyces antarcticus TaxID=2996458 RepID=UPI00226F61F6|nr:AfsR/SARP family transcriptional regulator [Streptomyces sp. H27-S2]MCY0951206.1 AfsR/SARP family transcriptional regulator [Streptomyces sp. H27-S2]
MDIDVLGGLRVTENGVPVVAPTPSARHVLAVLAAHANQVVPVSVLADELAGRVPPEHARAVAHSAVRVLRDRLAAALDAGPHAVRTAEDVLPSVPGGYLLDTGGGRCDLDEFERGAGAGYRAMARGDFDTAVRRLRGALDLWTGPAFAGVEAGRWLGARIAFLEESRLAVLGQWVEAGLVLGRHRELHTELSALLARQGGREQPDDPYLAALRRSGRRVWSLRHLHSLAAALDADGGRSPAAAVRALRRAVLMGPPGARCA